MKKNILVYFLIICVLSCIYKVSYQRTHHVSFIDMLPKPFQSSEVISVEEEAGRWYVDMPALLLMSKLSIDLYKKDKVDLEKPMLMP